MKTCRSCGSAFGDGELFCPYCGTKVEEVPADTETVAPESVQSAPAAGEEKYPMKWHRFLMVIMIIGGVIAVINGISAITGTEYIRQGLDADRVYSFYPGLKSCDFLYGLATIGLGIYEIIVRNRLNQFRENGPSMLKGLFILSIVVQLIYLASASSVTKINMFDSSTIGNLGGSAFMLIVNSIYYSRRRELFVR